MPVVKKGMFKGRYRPHCKKCGHFVGEGGLYNISCDYYGDEINESLCKKCYENQVEYLVQNRILNDYPQLY